MHFNVHQPFDPTPSIVQMDGAPAHKGQSTKARFAVDQITQEDLYRLDEATRTRRNCSRRGITKW